MATSIYSAFGTGSMIRLSCLLVLSMCSAVSAATPQFSNGGFLFSLQYGPGFWTVDTVRLKTQAPGEYVDLFSSDVQNTHTVSISLGYNIKGHATIGVDLTGTGWNLFDATRGGAGFLVGRVAWHPLELVWMRKEKRPFPLDVSALFGVGYGIAGRVIGFDGLVFELGLNADFFFTRFFALGVFSRFVLMDFHQLYTDFNNKVGVALPQGSGGSFITIGFTLTIRAGD